MATSRLRQLITKGTWSHNVDKYEADELVSKLEAKLPTGPSAFEGGAMTELRVGDRIEKVGGSYQAIGTAVGVFVTTSGKHRVVFEFDEPKGMLHIFDIAQIRLLPWTAQPK